MIRDRCWNSRQFAIVETATRVNTYTKKAIDAARQSEAAKREQALMRNFLPNAPHVDFVKAKRQPKSHPTKPKMAAKPQPTNRK